MPWLAGVHPDRISFSSDDAKRRQQWTPSFLARPDGRETFPSAIQDCSTHFSYMKPQSNIVSMVLWDCCRKERSTSATSRFESFPSSPTLPFSRSFDKMRLHLGTRQLFTRVLFFFFLPQKSVPSICTQLISTS